MSIVARIEDAQLLWHSGRHEGAFLSALIAVAATSRLRFPDRKAMNDGDAFEAFLKSTHDVRLSVEFRGELHSIERIFYKWLRCELVHEAKLPVDIEFFRDGVCRTLSVRAGGAPEFKLRLSEGWFQHLVGLVVSAQENTSAFSEHDV